MSTVHADRMDRTPDKLDDAGDLPLYFLSMHIKTNRSLSVPVRTQVLGDG